MAISNLYYPSVKDVLPISNIPSNLGFIEEGLSDLLNKVFYSELNIEKSPSGEVGFYYLRLVLLERLELELPGTSGIKLVLNPDVSSISSATSIPVTFEYSWPILKFISNFKGASFAEAPASIFALLKEITNITDEELIREISQVLFNTDTNPIQTIINKYNQYSSSTLFNIPDGFNTSETIELFVEHIDRNNQNLFTFLFNEIIQVDIDLNQILDRIKLIFKKWADQIEVSDILNYIIPSFKVGILDINVALEFPRTLLSPIDINTGLPNSDLEVKSLLRFSIGSLSFDSKDGFNFEGNNSITFDPSFIGQTGFYLGLSNMKIDLSRTKNIPEAATDGRSVDFIGVYIQDGTIGFPAFWNKDEGKSTGVIRARNLLVGTGGLSGTLGLEAKVEGLSNPLIAARFGSGFEVSLNTFSITFQQNAIVESNIQGTMKIPGFKDANENPALININVWIGTQGEFSVTASEDQGIEALEIPGIFRIIVSSLSVGRREGRFYAAVSGSLEFLNQQGVIGQLLPDSIEIQKLLIWEDGEIEYEGGALVLPSAMTLTIPPVALSVTAIGFGSYQQIHLGFERKYKFFEFNGGISVNPGGVDARGDGVKFYYTVDNGPGKVPHKFVRIQGIGIDLFIPSDADAESAALILKGYLSMKDPSPNNPNGGAEYAGGIDFLLPRLQMGGSAAMRLNPKVPAFLVDIDLNMDNPILLGTTGLGIYGFRALLGQRYVASKAEAGVADDGEWWQYYKAKIADEYKEGIQASKFEQTSGFSLGAGVTLATANDGGRAFSSKLFFLLSLRDVFLLQGQAQILKERIGLDTTTDPPFFAMIAVTKQSIEAAFGVNYMLPDDKRPGGIAKVDALIEMGFFFGNAASWYINIGRDLPESRRVNVRLLELFDSYFYMMMSSSGIKAGAGAKFEFDQSFGPLRAELRAYIDVAGRIAFKPKQYGASIHIGGKVGLYIFKFGFSISADAGLAAEAPKPFIVTGTLKVCVMVLKKERCAEFQFTWIKDNDLDLSEIEIMNSGAAASAVNMLTREPYKIFSATGNTILGNLTVSDLENYVVPMDSYIDLEFLKGVLPSTTVKELIGGNTQGAKYVDYVSPQKAKSSRVRHEFHLEQLNIKYWDNGSWQNFSVFSAATPLDLDNFLASDLTLLKSGYWQYQAPELHNKLRIMAQSPLSFLGMGSAQPGDIIVENLGVNNESIFCNPEPINKTCIDFTDLGKGTELGQIILAIPPNQIIHYQQFLFRINSINQANIVYNPFNNFINALALRENDELEIVFTEPVSLVSLRIQSQASNVKIHYFKRVEMATLAPTNLPQFDYVLAETKILQSNDLNNPVVYDDIENAIEKVIVEVCACETPEPGNPFVCDADISQTAKDLEKFLNKLASLRLHTAAINLFPDYQKDFNGIFQGTSLYGQTGIRNLVIQSSAGPITENSLTIRLTDNYGFSCIVVLETISQFIKWLDVVGFTNLRPYNTSLGVNYEFEIDAILFDNSTVTLRGRSCYPIIQCYNDCTTFIYQFCFLNFEDAQFNQTMPDLAQVQSETNAMIEGFNQAVQPIWRPNTNYVIEVITNDRLYKDSESNLITSFQKTHIFGFRTKGPLGHFHQTIPKYIDLSNVDREAEFKLANLQHYIDYEKSYPNADGALIKAKPLFYIAPELLLFYVKNYVVEFYRNWSAYGSLEELDIMMESIILDPAPDTSLPPASPIAVSWKANETPGFIIDAQTLDNMISNGDPCVSTESINPIGVNSLVSTLDLKPLKLYSAQFIAKYKLHSAATFEESEVHRYVFQTSRYGNFEEQVNSYILETDPNDTSIITKSALFTIELSNLTTTDLTNAIDIVNGNLDTQSILYRDFADVYDRLIDNVFKTGALHPAETTEFNVIKDDTGTVLGILVRNPEPFNDPKIPLNELQLTINVSSGTGQLDKKIFSKDRRNIFITNTALQLVAGLHDFEFKYVQWNGTQYEEKSLVELSLNID